MTDVAMGAVPAPRAGSPESPVGRSEAVAHTAEAGGHALEIQMLRVGAQLLRVGRQAGSRRGATPLLMFNVPMPKPPATSSVAEESTTTLPTPLTLEAAVSVRKAEAPCSRTAPVAPSSTWLPVSFSSVGDTFHCRSSSACTVTVFLLRRMTTPRTKTPPGPSNSTPLPTLIS